MGAAIKLDECYDEPAGEKLPPRVRAADSTGDGGNVDEILKRLDKMESTALETREQVLTIVAIIPHMATKADVSRVNETVSGIAAIIPHLATKADLRTEISVVQKDIKRSELSTVKWIIGIIVSVAGLAFTIGKFVH